ncbi:MAG: DUF11 domain-containing protein [Sedimentisphaerales bacterium]|nr:DUF11 domain-containing protein [Sedimentisphaerales bacterium]
MGNFFENLTMNKQKKCVLKAIKVLLLLAFVMTVITGAASAKSLYVLSDIEASPNPLRAYDIATNGTLTFQAQYSLPRYNLGATGIALDSESGYLFVTYVFWGSVIVVDSKTMVTIPEMTSAPGAWDLAGIVYNHAKKQLYCVDRGRDRIWVFNWDSNSKTLSRVSGAPFLLRNATTYGIALDESNQILYVANSTNKVYAYNTDDWSLKRTISLDRIALCVAVDYKNSYLYTGGGFVGNPYLTQYNLKLDKQLETVVETNASIGVMGIAVDPDSGKIYFTTGHDYLLGGDNIRVYDKLLCPVSVINSVGNPTGLVIPIKEVGFNPLNLKKSITSIINSEGETQSDSVNAGDLVTYRISFNNYKNEYTVTNVSVVDNLPNEVTFVSASDDPVFGQYDSLEHTYTWEYPSLVKGSNAFVDITVKINDNVLPKTSISNAVTIKSDTTPPVTTRAELITASRPLNLSKTVFGATEGFTKWVDVNEVITYNIYLDNLNNNFAATDVVITDTLPDDIIFIAADDDVSGQYDEGSHTYTWTIPSLASQESVDLGITVRLQEGIEEGTTITNTVTVESAETVSSVSSADIRVGVGPVAVKSVQVIPSTIRRDSNLSGIMVILEMPLGYKVKDITNTPLLLSLAGDSEAVAVLANSDQMVTQSLDKTYVIAVFDKKKVMNAIPGYGTKNIQIEGALTNNSLFIGYATINITKYAGN